MVCQVNSSFYFFNFFSMSTADIKFFSPLSTYPCMLSPASIRQSKHLFAFLKNIFLWTGSIEITNLCVNEIMTTNKRYTVILIITLYVIAILSY
jgi:hypothetical protein